jgi:hypothetical protein
MIDTAETAEPGLDETGARLYRIGVTVAATAHVRASSPATALALANEVLQDCILEIEDAGSGVAIRGIALAHPSMPDVSLLPDMTIVSINSAVEPD